MRSRRARPTASARPGATTLRRRNSSGVDAERARQLVDRRLRPRTRSAAGRSRGTRRPARCWCRRRSRRPSCSGSGRRRSIRDRHGTAPGRRDCRRRRCWRRRRSCSAVSVPSRRAPTLTRDLHRMPRGGGDELLLAGELELHRPAGLERGQRERCPRPASPACRRSRRRRARRTRAPCPGRGRRRRASSCRVRNGTCVLERTFSTPSASIQAMAPWVSRCACWTRGTSIGALVDGVGLRRSRPRRRRTRRARRRRGCAWRRDAGFRALVVVQQRRAGLHRLLRIEHRRQHLVVDLEPAAAFLGGGFAVGDDGGDPLADEAHDVVEHPRVVGIDQSRSRGARSRTASFGASSCVSTAMHAGHAQAPRSCRWRGCAHARAASAAA